MLYNGYGDSPKANFLDIRVANNFCSKRKHDQISNDLNIGNGEINQIANEDDSPQVYSLLLLENLTTTAVTNFRLKINVI